MSFIKIAVLQMPVVMENVEENLQRVMRHLVNLPPASLDLIALPEMWTTDFTFENTRSLARETVRAQVRILKEAKRLKAAIVGSVLEESKGGYYNTATIYSGSFVSRKMPAYRKIHLFRPLKEDKFFKSGRDLKVVKLAQVKVGLSICYDLRFPELYRALAARGAQMILVPSAWPLSRLSHWRTLLQARAVENQVFVVGVNRVGVSSRGFDFAGHSMIVGPWGEILWEGSEKDAAFSVCELDLDQIAQAREKISVWQDQRTDLYKSWLHESLGKKKRAKRKS